MGIKSSLYLQKSFRTLFLCAVLALFFAGCAQIKTRNQISKKDESTPGARQEQPFDERESEVSETEIEKDGGDFQEMPAPKPQKKSSPRLGIILSGGGARTFAHAGVLKILESEKIPVHAIVGLEWASLMAGIYAQDGSVHNLEWKLYKLRDKDLPGQSLLSKAFSKDNVSTMNEYLNTVFQSTRIEKAKLPFSCPSISTDSGSVVWLARGSFKSTIESCLPYPPLFASKGNRFGEPMGLEQAAQWLRREGAEVVVFIDVLSEGDLWKASNLPEDESSRLLWWEVRRQYRSGAKGIDEIIRVPLSRYGIGEFTKRKAIAEAGQGSGRELSRKLLQNHNF